MPANLKLTADSGGGTTAIAAPASTTGNANVVWKLPIADGSSGQALTTNASGQLAFSDVGGSGLTEADQWRITSGASIPADTNTLLTSNWERVDRDGQNKLGTGLTESSGIFSFPSTGIWRVEINVMVEESEDMRGARIYIRTTTDNESSWHEPSESWGGINTNSTGYTTLQCSTLFDVTNTTNCKVIFLGNSTNATAFAGSSAANRTYATFMRLGDT